MAVLPQGAWWGHLGSAHPPPHQQTPRGLVPSSWGPEPKEGGAVLLKARPGTGTGPSAILCQSSTTVFHSDLAGDTDPINLSGKTSKKLGPVYSVCHRKMENWELIEGARQVVEGRTQERHKAA